MNRLILFIYSCLLLVSCSPNSEQIDAAKKQLGLEPTTLEKYTFKVVEIPAKDVYNMLVKHYQEQVNSLHQFPEIKDINLKNTSKYLKRANEAGERKCFRVHAFRPATESSREHDVYIFLDENNEYLISNVKH